MADVYVDIVYQNFNNEKLAIVLDYLKSFKDISKAIEDEKCYEYLSTLHIVSFTVKVETLDMNVYVDKEAYVVFANYLSYLSKICGEFDFDAYLKSAETLSSLSSSELNKKRIEIFYLILAILNSVMTRSPVFNFRFNQTVGLKAILTFLQNEKFIEGSIDMMGMLLADINWLSKCSDENKLNWTNVNAAEILLSSVKFIRENKNLMILYQAIINIVDDKQIESRRDIQACVDLVLEYFRIGADRLVQGFCTSLEKEIYIENMIKKEKIHCIRVENGYQSLAGLLQSLYRLAVNETMRFKIYESVNFKEHIKVYLFKGNRIEIKIILNLLAQISFSSKLALDLCQDQEIINYIDKIITDTESDELKLKQACKQIKWNIETNNKSNESDTSGDMMDTNGHIMISYNTASRDLCMRVKQQLETAGFKVWIDISDIHGSSLAAMAQAVEMSQCVLICVTEKYRQSINCQAEAQYAFKLKKPIIPLIMQSGYENVTGWLGIIMGDKIFVNFTKYDFDECIRRLRKELENCTKQITSSKNEDGDVLYKAKTAALSIESSTKTESAESNETNVMAKKTSVATVSSPSLVGEWDMPRVAQWFSENKLNKNIHAHLEPCSGEVLKQIYDMKCRAPEFYFQSLSKINNVDLNAIVVFSSCLDKLFKSDS